jgi:alkylation response protein AidB-like acyl-CoA dehydrogenase
MSLKQFANGKFNECLLAGADFERVFHSSDRIESVIGELNELQKMVDSKEINRICSIPTWLTTKLFQLGIYSITLQQKYGGLEASMLDFVKLAYALAKVDASVAMSVIPHTGMGLGSILKFANDAQKEIILRDLVSGEKIIAFAMTEAHTGSDLTGMYTALKRDDSTENYLLSGSKSWITNGGVADTIVVCAKCPDLVDVPHASLFVYLRGNEKGLIKKDLYDKMGHRGAVTTDIYFEDVKISPDRIIGVPGKGYEQFNTIVDSGRFGVAAAALAMVSKATHFAFDDKECNMSIPALIRLWTLSLIFQMEAVLYLGALAHDLNLKDRSSITSLVKIFCSSQAWKIVNRLREFISPVHDKIIAVFDQLFDDVPISRITEGPNEVIGYRCSLDIVTSLPDKNCCCDSVIPFLTPSLHAPGAILDAALVNFSGLVRQVRMHHRPLAESQLALDRVLRLSTDLFALLATLLYTNAYLKTAKNPERNEIGLQSSVYLSKKIERTIREVELEEMMNADSTVSRLSDKMFECCT